MAQKIEKNSEEVVGYYNILYNLENKENKENIQASEVSSPADKDDTFISSRSGLEPCGSKNPDLPSGHLGEGVLASEMVNCDLSQDDVVRSIFHFFDNGEETTKRYKLKARLNLVDKENVEFIATLTKDWSNFKKYIPKECRKEIIEEARILRANIKKNFGIIPYMGKFHLNQGLSKTTTRAFTQIEPWTWAFAWYDKEYEYWRYSIRMYSWCHQGDFSKTHLTAAQVKSKVKGQDLFINPKYDQRERPKTWAQLRAEKRAGK
jgi:hypothetical protein